MTTLAGADPNDNQEEVERRLQLAKFVSRLELLPHPELICNDRSLEEVGERAVALSEKGKVARVLDKAKDSAEVVTLVEKLRRAMVIYQVSVGRYQSRQLLTPGTDVATTVDIQPGVPIGCEFQPPISLQLTEPVGRIKASFDELLKLRQVGETAREWTQRITRF